MTGPGWECPVKKLHAGPEKTRVRQIIPVSEPWHVEISPLTAVHGDDGRTRPAGWPEDEARFFPVIGWALLEDGCIQPLFVEAGAAYTEVTWPSYYRVMHHDCGEMDDPPGQKFSILHNINAVRGTRKPVTGVRLQYPRPRGERTMSDGAGRRMYRPPV